VEVGTIPDWAGGGEIPSLYVNSTGIAMSQWDLTIDFQLATPPDELSPGETYRGARRVARIVMSPTHAKVIAESLSAAVRDWQERFGALPSVDELLQRAQGQQGDAGHSPDATTGNVPSAESAQSSKTPGPVVGSSREGNADA
jgi:hypothetical protein